ncbi:MAG TPA: BamA/TamA family outer membrane protein [Vicinamibacterales bacterium]|nr:BamA/TamA family outer membrane protein [Vicinamibacterales bacterium]
MTSISAVSIVFLAVILTPIPASPQDSRAADIAAEQAAKSRQLTPNTATGAEKALEWFEDHFTDPNTFYLTFGGLYPSGGFGPGLAGRRAFGHARLNAGVAYSLRGYKLAQTSLNFPELAGDKLEIETRVRWTDATQVPFYGVGNGSIKDDRVSYGLRSLDGGASIALKPVPWYQMGGGIAVRHMEDRAGTGRFPSIETLSSPSPPPALFSDTRYTETTAFTAIDWRESPGYTRRGGLYRVALNDFRDTGDNYSFRRVDAEIQQFIPLLKEHWVLAFRGLVQTTDVDDAQVVPYYLLPTLGGARMHRGYPDFRFQDRHLMLLSGEYRWLPSRIVDMALFVDAGKVAHERRDLDFDDLKTAYGIGLRIHGPTFTPLRLDVARGTEGIRVHLTGGIAF